MLAAGTKTFMSPFSTNIKQGNIQIKGAYLSIQARKDDYCITLT